MVLSFSYQSSRHPTLAPHIRCFTSFCAPPRLKFSVFYKSYFKSATTLAALLMLEPAGQHDK